MTTDQLPAGSEMSYQTAIVEAAMYRGWLVHAELTAKRGDAHMTAIQGQAGWPDLILCRPPQLLIIELKRKPNRPTDEQRRWVGALADCGLDARVRYVPEEYEAILEALT